MCVFKTRSSDEKLILWINSNNVLKTELNKDLYDTRRSLMENTY